MEFNKEKEQPKNPREGTNFFSYMCFCYAVPIMFKGRKRELAPTDLYRALEDHKSSSIGQRLYDAWENQLVSHRRTGKAPSLLRAMISVFGVQFCFLGLAVFIVEILVRMPQPLYIGGLIYNYGNNGDGPDLSLAYVFAGAVILSTAMNIYLTHPYMMSFLHVGMKMRVAMCSIIYRKSLKLSHSALGETTAGQVVNLLSNDVSRFDMAIINLHYLWVAPLEMCIVTYLMFREIQVSAFCGIVFLVAFIPLQIFLGNKTSSLRLKIAKATDGRVRLMNEIILGMQVIKMYAWEKPFGKLISTARLKEINIVRYANYIRGIMFSFIVFVTRVSIFFSLVVFALLGNVVTAEKAFVVTAFFNILRLSMTLFFPQAITQYAEVMVSIRRIEAFMMYDEKDDVPLKAYMAAAGVPLDDSKHSNGNAIERPSPVGETLQNAGQTTTPGIQINNLRSRWNHSSVEYTLDGVNLDVKPQTLVALIGPVGSGKSSLIQAILRELPIESGSVVTSGDISFASQEPWLFSGSVRTNILFGQPMNKVRYRLVVHNCALERDFALLPHGDKTIVGERGTSLSGGQKARISLARACYRDAAIYLLDDPLSAVDPHVGKHLFDRCLRGLLRSKIVILATHQLQYLQHVDQIVIFNHGRVEATGTYEYLRKTGLDFAKLLADPTKEDPTNESSLSDSTMKLHRRSSAASSQESIDGEECDDPLPDKEKQQSGSIGLSVYKQYYGSGGGFFVFVMMAFFFVVSQLLASGGDYFIMYWVNKEESVEPSDEESLNDSRLIDIYIFTGITIATVVLTLSRSFYFFNMALRASTALHNRMYDGITRATMHFLHTNPSGRVLNRFSKDIGQIDEILPAVMIDVFQIFLQLFGIVVVVAIGNVWLLIPTIVISIMFYYMRDFYLKTSRALKRMDAISRSPIYSHLGASLSGLSTIRAFGAETVLIEEFDHLQDINSSAFYLFLATSRVFGLWLDILSLVFLVIVMFSAFMGNSDGALIGLSITQALGLTGYVQWGMRQSAELENNMNAVERVVEYSSLDAESELEAAGDKKPPAEWPDKGAVKFDKISLRYFPDPDSEMVLKELEFEVQPREKVGIVGRTGAGKSSLINALFRLSYNDGSIVIDGRDIHSMGLHDLRKKISIIPQEPVLFSGTMRYNLDPFNEYTDEKVWSALDEVKLKAAIVDMPHGLQSRITEGGGNFSVGQRQLVCLARAILRENRVLVMDEATANVDPQTDKLIQATIRTKFVDCTIFTIAHRLNTVMDSDKVLVMDAGRVIEYGSPYQLLTDTDGPRMFYSMVEEMGQSTFAMLLDVAKSAHESRTNI